MKRYEVAVRRANGRFVKSFIVTSKYAAKSLRNKLEMKYDDSYYIEIKVIGR